jgi:dihydroorotase-like cyclic amidohydrolase
MSRFDTAITGGHVVVPGHGTIECGIGIRDGRIAALDDDIRPGDGEEHVDASGLIVMPGAIDAHYHLGIYRSIEADVATETASSLVGGATTIISYFRTGHHYMDRTGPYREILPDLLAATEGRSHTDFGYHIAPMTAEHLGEIEWLVDQGIASFKYYFFYKGLNLAADSTDAQAYTMSERYDFGHLYAMMEEIARVERQADRGDRVSLSLHCENAELITLFMERVRDGVLPPLQAYSESRPPLTERLSIHEAGVLADATRVRVNLLHLSSAEAVRAAREVRSLYPELDLRLETTVHHLALTYDMLDGKGLGGKVNPPIRTAADVDALWSAVTDGTIQWVASDHACCLEELKGDELWPALPGFGGTALLYPVLLSEGYHRRRLPLQRIAELASTAPATAFGCHPRKGSIMVGADADLALIDLEREHVVTPELLHSAQDHTPFAGVRVKGWPVRTLLRGETVFAHGEIVGSPLGRFVPRPVKATKVQASDG